MKRKARPKPRAKPVIDAPVVEACRGLRRRREDLGLTLEDLAERSELSPNYIGAIELGRRDPSLSSMQAIAVGYGVPLAQLFGTPKPLSPSAIEMARLFTLTAVELQKALLMVLHAVVKTPRT